jgi:hypothetical protein
MGEQVCPGRYKHFKGGEYVVVGVARDSESQEPMVVYYPVANANDLWVRSVEMWGQTVELDGVSSMRFRRLEGG